MNGAGKQRRHRQAVSLDGAAAAQEEPAANDALVLIVEDERPIADAIRLVVEDAGYRALLAYNGTQGLELARTQHPALITTDYMMPGLNGAELIAALHADAAHNGGTTPPIIMISAVTSPQVHRSGYDRFLSKPFDIDELTELLHLFLRQDQSTGEGIARP